MTTKRTIERRLDALEACGDTDDDTDTGTGVEIHTYTRLETGELRNSDGEIVEEPVEGEEGL
jgi:HAMP domain-containing protein